MLSRDGRGNYLFEFVGETEAAPRSHLLIPASPAGMLSFDMMARYRVGMPEVEVGLMLQALSKDRPAAAFKVAASGEWSHYSLGIPAGIDAVRPLKIGFVAKERQAIFYRRVGFEPQR